MFTTTRLSLLVAVCTLISSATCGQNGTTIPQGTAAPTPSSTTAPVMDAWDVLPPFGYEGVLMNVSFMAWKPSDQAVDVYAYHWQSKTEGGSCGTWSAGAGYCLVSLAVPDNVTISLDPTYSQTMSPSIQFGFYKLSGEYTAVIGIRYSNFVLRTFVNGVSVALRISPYQVYTKMITERDHATPGYKTFSTSPATEVKFHLSDSPTDQTTAANAGQMLEANQNLYPGHTVTSIVGPSGLSVETENSVDDILFGMNELVLTALGTIIGAILLVIAVWQAIKFRARRVARHASSTLNATSGASSRASSRASSIASSMVTRAERAVAAKAIPKLESKKNAMKNALAAASARGGGANGVISIV